MYGSTKMEWYILVHNVDNFGGNKVPFYTVMVCLERSIHV